MQNFTWILVKIDINFTSATTYVPRFHDLCCKEAKWIIYKIPQVFSLQVYTLHEELYFVENTIRIRPVVPKLQAAENNGIQKKNCGLNHDWQYFKINSPLPMTHLTHQENQFDFKHHIFSGEGKLLTWYFYAYLGLPIRHKICQWSHNLQGGN